MHTFDLKTPYTELERYLKGQGWLESGESIENLSLAGSGNMNVVLRIRTGDRSLILKQSRPYVQKYPDIPAPPERIGVEHAFYQAVSDTGIGAYLPEILGFDPEEFTLVMQDLGETEDMSRIYNERRFDDAHLLTLIGILKKIHQADIPSDYPENRELRRLNHQHIFVLPFLKDNGFPLDELQAGLSALALPFKEDTRLKEKINALGDRYLSQGDTLLHGDYYPGSWLETENKVFVIDPEFSFAGFPEFDLGVMVAHALMASMEAEMPERCLQAYGGDLHTETVRAIAGIEILRRLIGLAQLPMERSLEEKEYLLQEARKLLSA